MTAFIFLHHCHHDIVNLVHLTLSTPQIKTILNNTKAFVRVDTKTCMITIDGPTPKAVSRAVKAVEAVQAKETEERDAAAARASERLEREKKLKRDERRADEAKQSLGKIASKGESLSEKDSRAKGRERKDAFDSVVDSIQAKTKGKNRGRKRKTPYPDAEGAVKADGVTNGSPASPQKKAKKAEEKDDSKAKAAAKAFREAKKNKAKKSPDLKGKKAPGSHKSKSKSGGKGSPKLGVVPSAGFVSKAKITSGLE